jgi:metal-responsive CopG/Arc/MetJ family transcriptional regulator
MIPVQIRLTKKIIDMIDELVESGMYPNRSEVVRDASRWFVMKKNCVVECPMEKGDPKKIE